MALHQIKETRKESITIRFLYEGNRERLQLKSYTGETGFDRMIRDKNVHRPQLALAGFVKDFRYDRVQIFGNTEIRYLEQLSGKERAAAVSRLFAFEIPCIIVTSDNPVAADIVEAATARNVAVFGTPLETTKAIYFISDILDDIFALQCTIHASFVDVYGVGLLLTGRSGIGKSEIALDLVERGHRLVADDVVMITRKGEGILMGAGSQLVKHFMEIRGLGLLDVRSMFGIRAIRFQKRVEVVVELMDWSDKQEYTRTGLDSRETAIMDVRVQSIELPIFPGKNVTVICEVIALNYLLKHYGYDAAQEFTKRLESVIHEKTKELGERAIDYFEHDFE
jgi:HPr kinase/phosphorylase